MSIPKKIDLHMHTRVSDGTDTPEEILLRVKDAGIGLFAVTDHDAVKGCRIILDILKPEDPQFITGAEFSCKDEYGKYHILGYGYEPQSEGVQRIVDLGHSYRMNKVRARVEFVEKEFGFVFSQEDKDALFALDNPGKPHIGNLMVKYGYVKTKEEAILDYINKIHFKSEYVRPEEAIAGILASGGIPVLAHPSYGSGDQPIIGKEMEERISRLMGFGLQGLEAFYSGFPKRLTESLLTLAEKNRLYVTAGSDYHGKNKLIELGDTNLEDAEQGPAGMKCFFEKVRRYNSERRT